MNEQQSNATITYQAQNIGADIDVGLEPTKWYFVDAETYGYIGPYETEDDAKDAHTRFNQYI